MIRCGSILALLVVPMGVWGQQSPDTREWYAVEMDRHSGGRFFLAPAEAPARATAGAVYTVTGTVLSKSATRPLRMSFEVFSHADELLHTLEVTKEIESGANPFGFEWPTAGVSDGDYRVRIRVLDPAFGEEARLEQRVALRSRATVAAEIERARGLVVALRDAHPEMPPFAAQQIRLAMEALAPFPDSDRPLIEADLNARFARAAAGAVRARLALASGKEAAVAEQETPALETAGLMGGGVVARPGSPADSPAELGFTFAPHVLTPASAEALGSIAAAADIPRMVWLTSLGENAQPPSPAVLGRVAALGGVAGVSLWTAPKIALQGEEIHRDFQAYVQGVYADRHALNRAWKERFFEFSEVQFVAFSESRAYQYDAQSFRRVRTAQWIADQLRVAASALAPAAPLLTFSEGILLPGESRAGLDAETLAPRLPMVPVRTAGPFEGDRYAQRFPALQLVWALMHSFAPDKPLIALHALDYTLDDRVRLDSAAHVRTLAIEAALEHVGALALEFPALTDPLSQAPEAVAALAQALRDLDRAAGAIAALRDAPAPVAIVWSDSSKVLDDGAAHLAAFARAYEGCAFAGYTVDILSERQLAEGRWRGVRTVVLPEVTALGREAFAGLEAMIAGGASVVRTELGPTYDERGNALGKTLPVNDQTLLVRGNGGPAEYLSALDELHARGLLENIPRAITSTRYPLEGVKTRYAETPTGRFLYVLNLRREPVACRFSLPVEGATDLLSGRTVDFPRRIEPLSPMLLRLADGAAAE